MINDYSISNFKIHKEGYRFNLKGLSIITGTNNSGKSSLTQSLRLLSYVQDNSREYTRLPIEFVKELKNFSSVLNKNVNRKDSITYKLSLDIENFEFCNIELEFDSIFNYNFSFKDSIEQAILKRIDIYFKNKEIVKNYEFNIDNNDDSIVTYNLNELDNENNKKVLIQKDIFIKGLNIFFIPNALTEELKCLIVICNRISNLNSKTIKYIPALRNIENLAELLDSNKDKIIFDGNTKMLDAFNNWTQKILKSKFDIKTENNVNKIIVIDNDVEFDLCQVGFGNEQILPIIIKILIANKGDLVIIENPEIHLHPKWKTNLVELFYFAVKNDVNILIETQSLEIVNRVRLFIKKDNSLKEKTSLYFFKKDKFDCNIQNIEIENTGNLDSWPEDFIDRVSLEDNFELM
ncbi:DUF3696 domain-containing protein [Clostridium perfringens]|uniref:DUF3696 domain-containing protein n=1 Tax=Clostridium perfringens TaxID=1502 RepID=A0A8H9QYE9_CLOPF|nr:DUF3696 domain-containing protein [Clostridium perfringens]